MEHLKGMISSMCYYYMTIAIILFHLSCNSTESLYTLSEDYSLNCDTLYEYRSIFEVRDISYFTQDAVFCLEGTNVMATFKSLLYDTLIIDTAFVLSVHQKEILESVRKSFYEYNVPEGYYTSIGCNNNSFLFKDSIFTIKLTSKNLFDLLFLMTNFDTAKEYRLLMREKE